MNRRARVCCITTENDLFIIQVEWEDLMKAIRNDETYNEVKRGAEASLVTAMGWLSAHTGQIVTWDDMLNHDHELGAGVDQLTLNSDSPLRSAADGTYPYPLPGLNKTREF